MDLINKYTPSNNTKPLLILSLTYWPLQTVKTADEHLDRLTKANWHGIEARNPRPAS